MNSVYNKKIFIISLIFFFVSLFLNLYFFLRFKDQIFVFKNKNNRINAKVVRVIDGDTFDTSDERIRLYEVDAPEYPNGCLSEEAKNRLKELLLNKEIAIEKINKDKFGRTLAYVYLNDIFINQSMISEGLAIYNKGKFFTEKSYLLQKEEDLAKKLKRGIFSSLCLSEKPGCLIKGNYREADNTRIYHTPDCYNYQKITIRPNSQDRWFCSEEEATKAGFIKSKDCPNNN
ncbi:MAG: thermonuclease family protein [Patescibacteria group bacterium]|nr:thermonuclease family protein [Patescibacteria group bacterium]